MAMTIPKYMHPRFYMKKAGESFSLHHRLTHAFIGNFSSEQELKDELEWYNEMTEQEFWEDLLEKRQVRIPKQHGTDYNFVGKDSEEEWFLSAWSFYTDDFYNRFPKLLVEVDTIPYDLIAEIRRSKYAKELAESRKAELDKREAEKVWQAEQKAIEKARHSDRIIKPKEGKIGSKVGMEEAKRKVKRIVKKAKVTTPSNKVITLMDSDDLFA